MLELTSEEKEVLNLRVKKKKMVTPRWKKGESGNPMGRPRGVTPGQIKSSKIKLTAHFLDVAHQEWETLLKILFEEAKNRNHKCLFFILENALYKMIQRVEEETQEDLKTLSVEEITKRLLELQEKRKELTGGE